MINLYIIEQVLSDYTSGMVVIAAASLKRCRELFVEEFDWYKDEYDCAIEKGHYKVLQAANQPEGIVSYVYGGG